MKLLILGGTSDALEIAQQVLQQHQVIYSIKGLVRQPKLACTLHSGGFGGVTGLIQFLQQQQIDYLIDATHPYAATISHHANLAAQATQIPCFHYQRPAWVAHPDDHWITFQNINQLPLLFSAFTPAITHPFFALGQLPLAFINKKATHHTYVIRTVVDTIKAQTKVIPIVDRGAFSIANEHRLFQQYSIDALISKNSGGDKVVAKIRVARAIQCPVFMLQRPPLVTKFPILAIEQEVVKAINELIKL